MIRFIANALLSPIHIIKILLQSIRGAVTPNINSCGALIITIPLLLLGMYVPCLNSYSKLTEHTCLIVMNATRLDRWPLFMAQTSIERSLLALYKVKV